jgi:hypothetical protein
MDLKISSLGIQMITSRRMIGHTAWMRRTNLGEEECVGWKVIRKKTTSNTKL